MRKRIMAAVAALAFLSTAASPKSVPASPQNQHQPPKSASVEVILISAPGIDDEGSQWEIAYEFRVANEKTLWQRRADMKVGSEKRVGDLIKEGTAKGTLRSAANRRFLFTIPFSAELQTKLRNQPGERVRVVGDMSEETIKQLSAQETNSQVFLFYPVINIYDSRLKKNFVINTSRIWDYESYPDARFTIKIEIGKDGGYKVNSSLPTK